MRAGEENRRHRRNHVAKKHYVDPQGRKGVRLQFYLQGVRILEDQEVPSPVPSQVRNKGTVQLDAREDSGGQMQTRFLVVEVGFSPYLPPVVNWPENYQGSDMHLVFTTLRASSFLFTD